MTNFLDKLKTLSPEQLISLAVDQQARLEAVNGHESIAIVGMGCRFPGADSPEAFWRLLDEGRCATRDVPADRWDRDALFHPDRDAPGRVTVRAGGFLDDVAGFDAGFFGISPLEARSMDPQQRLLLEVTWEALENAGIPPDHLTNTATGVFVGQCNCDYLQRLLWRGDVAIDGYLASGTSPGVTSGRLAYCLGFRGPALTVDTACSSSLVALHLACRSLRLRETQVALAAGVNLICAPESAMALSKAHMLAPDGRTKAFDARADGMGRGEGIAVLVLKRLADAVSEGDPVLAVIRGSAINQDGRSAGLTVPNRAAQEAVIAAALADAGVLAHDIAYVEAHGTGTLLGDPIEVRALSNALGGGRTPEQKLLIGSVKSNIGHLEGAAGLAGVIKAVLCLQHARIVPQPLFGEPNPHIPWAQIPVAVSTRQAWPEGAALLAGVSSFGFSGTNAHVVLEQGVARRELTGSRAAERMRLQCLVLSARSLKSLRSLALGYATLLEQGVPFEEVARDAALGRAQLVLRLAVVAGRGVTAGEALRAYAAGQTHPSLLVGPSTIVGPFVPPVCFAPDFHAYAPPIGHECYAASDAFREVIDHADRLMGNDSAGCRLSSILWDRDATERNPGRARSAFLAVQCATVALWRSFGVAPVSIRGEGVGELSAAYLQGRLDFDEALRRAANDSAALSPAATIVSGPVTVIGAGAPGDDEWTTLARTLGQWYVSGASLNWRMLGGKRGQTRLPNYAFDHQRYWVDVPRPVPVTSEMPVSGSGNDMPATPRPAQPIARPPLDTPPVDQTMTDQPIRAPLVAHLIGLPFEDRAEAVENWVCRAVARTLALSDQDMVSVGTGFFELGMDSLMAVALQRQLERDIGRPLPTTLSFNHPNAGALARCLASLLELRPDFPPAEDSVPASIAALSDEEVELRLRARLEAVG